jgi:hypothetical protein
VEREGGRGEIEGPEGGRPLSFYVCVCERERAAKREGGGGERDRRREALLTLLCERESSACGRVDWEGLAPSVQLGFSFSLYTRH